MSELDAKLAQQLLNILANIKGDIAAGRTAESAILRAHLVLDCAAIESPKGEHHNCGENCKVHNPAPTGPTVERWMVHRYFRSTTCNITTHYWRGDDGIITAMCEHNNGSWREGKWVLTLPNEEELVIDGVEYRALCKLAVENGWWEKI